MNFVSSKISVALWDFRTQNILGNALFLFTAKFALYPHRIGLSHRGSDGEGLMRKIKIDYP